MTPEQIKALRVSLGRTKEGMAKIVGTTSTTIYRWESGATSPNPFLLEKLMKLQKWQETRGEEE